MKVIAGIFALLLASACGSDPGAQPSRPLGSEALVDGDLPLPRTVIEISTMNGQAEATEVRWESGEQKTYDTGLCDGATSERGRLWTETGGGSTVLSHACVFDEVEAAEDAFRFNVDNLASLTDLPNLATPESTAAAEVDTREYGLQSDSHYLTCGISGPGGSCGAWILIARHGRLLTVLDVDADSGGFPLPEFVRMMKTWDTEAGRQVA